MRKLKGAEGGVKGAEGKVKGAEGEVRGAEGEVKGAEGKDEPKASSAKDDKEVGSLVQRGEGWDNSNDGYETDPSDVEDEEAEPDGDIQIIKSRIARRFQGEDRAIAYTRYTGPNAARLTQQGTIKPQYMHVFDSGAEIDDTLHKCGWKSMMFRHQPLWWQRVGIAWMLGVENTNEDTDQFAAKRGILANATGLGKTYETVGTILCSDHGHSNRYSLIIVPLGTRC